MTGVSSVGGVDGGREASLMGSCSAAGVDEGTEEVTGAAVDTATAGDVIADVASAWGGGISLTDGTGGTALDVAAVGDVVPGVSWVWGGCVTGIPGLTFTWSITARRMFQRISLCFCQMNRCHGTVGPT